MDKYKTIFRPIFIYRCHTWTVSRRMKSTLQAAEMNLLRRVKGNNKNRQSKKPRSRRRVRNTISVGICRAETVGLVGTHSKDGERKTR